MKEDEEKEEAKEEERKTGGDGEKAGCKECHDLAQRTCPA